MPARPASRALAVAASAALAVTGVVAVSSATAGPATIEITENGVGAVKLGATYRQLRDARLVGKMTEGCELAGPGTRAATLKAPLKGSVGFTSKGKARVRDVVVHGGAHARGVEVGDKRKELRVAFPGVTFNHGTDETFGITLATVPRRAGGRIQFAIDVDTKRVTDIGVPYIPFCE